LDLVAPLLKRHHADYCARDTAGNRSLHFDQYCMLILLCLFNPAISSLRALDLTITLVDGSLVSAMSSILAASFFKQDNSIEIQRNLHWTQQ